MLRIWRGAWTKRTRLAHGRYSVRANNGKKSRNRIDMTTPWAWRAPSLLPLLLVVDEEEEDPEDVGTGTRFVTDAVLDCETTEVVTPDDPPAVEAAAPADVVPAEPAEVVPADPPALLLPLPEDATNGFAELPPVPEVKSMVIVPMVLCCCRFSPRSVESTGEPSLMAQIQLLLLEVGSMLPPDQLMHPSQRMFAIIEPSELDVEPSSTVIEVAVLEEY
jgi:hypothetical protein